MRAGTPALLFLAMLLRTPELAVTSSEPSQELHVTFDSQTWTLTWNCMENFTVTSCTVMKAGGRMPIIKHPRKDECRCRFHALLLHRGLSLEVHAAANGSVVHRKLEYVNAGADGTAARNLSCFIYAASVMNCSWEPGPAAPPDVQYFLFLRDARAGSERECPQYLGDSVLHIGCRVQNLSGFPSDSYVLVNGTSRRTAIQFLDSMFNSKEIERLSAPHNITLTCNLGRCQVTWSQPPTWARLTFQDFKYELDVQQEHLDPGRRNPMMCPARSIHYAWTLTGSFLSNSVWLDQVLNDRFCLEADPGLRAPGSIRSACALIWILQISLSSDAENKYEFPIPEPLSRLSVRIRAGDVRSNKWSPWSPEVTFGSKERRFPLLYLYFTVVLATAFCALGLGFACKRLTKAQTLFPHIPQIKDKLTDDSLDPQMLSADFLPGLQKGNTEDVVTVEVAEA